MFRCSLLLAFAAVGCQTHTDRSACLPTTPPEPSAAVLAEVRAPAGPRVPLGTPTAPTYDPPPSSYPVPSVPPMNPPTANVTLAVANVRKEPVTLFRVENSRLTFVKKVAAGDAVDVTELAGTVLAATFADAPHCVNYVVPPSPGQTWLLRAAAPK